MSMSLRLDQTGAHASRIRTSTRLFLDEREADDVSGREDHHVDVFVRPVLELNPCAREAFDVIDDLDASTGNPWYQLSVQQRGVTTDRNSYRCWISVVVLVVNIAGFFARRISLVNKNIN